MRLSVRAHLMLCVTLVTVWGCGGSVPAETPAPETPAIQTLHKGVIRIAITGNATDTLDPEAWMNRYAERLAADAEDVKALESLAKEIESAKPASEIKPSANTTGEEVGG